ncbi:MAG TPA: membrane protein insertion efficiency factor YidD [Azonexus sp.]|nr:membrane protein insertion efficiency factor YidD [Azonexus sp.]
MRQLALAAIRLYQRHISPRKGFCCAYRHHTGHASCSALGYRAIRRFGLWRGIGVLRRRLGKCGVAHRRYAVRRPAFHGQAGFCDLPCDLPCDFDASGCAGNLLADCSPCDCSGDWGSSRKNKQDEQWVHIPPNSGRSGQATKAEWSQMIRGSGKEAALSRSGGNCSGASL